MKRFSITNKMNGNKFTRTEDELTLLPEFGLPERWVSEKNASDIELKTAIDRRESKELGREILLPAQYEITEEDMTKEIEEAAEREEEHKNYRDELDKMKGRDLSDDEVKSAIRMMLELNY